MRRTILSENQYDPTFMSTAKTKAIMRPLAPPISSPMTSSNPLSAPSSTTVFTLFPIALRYRLQSTQ